MSQDEQWTIKRLLEWTTDYFKKNNFDSPRLDAEILLAESLDCKRIDLYMNFTKEPSESERTKFRGFVKRRASGEPVAYLVGRKEFYSLSFEVTPATLIPRPETEHLVVEVLDLLAKNINTHEPSICDMGTGSGAIAVTIAKNAPKCRVSAVDLSPEAIEVAKRNADIHEVSDKLSFFVSDLFEDLPDGLQFDFIVSNPPYVSVDEYENLSSEIKNFEPKMALVAENDGLAMIEKLIEQADQRLNDGGHLLIELSPMIAQRAAEMLKKRKWRHVRILKDLAGYDRIVAAVKKT